MLVFTEHFRESTSTCRTLYSSISQTPNYLPVRVISFAVFLARLSVSLHEIAHTRAILPTYYEKKKIKTGTSNTQLLKSQFPVVLRNITNLGIFQKNVTQEETVFTRSCFLSPPTIKATYLARFLLSTISTLIFQLVSQTAPPIKTARAIKHHVLTLTSPPQSHANLAFDWFKNEK